MRKVVLALAIVIISTATSVRFSLAHTATSDNHDGHSISWLLNQPSQHFALQLARNSNYSEIIKLIAKYKLEDRAIIYENKQPEVSVYTLLYGIYPDKHEAMEVGSSLPDPELKSKAWVKKMETIQTELKKNYPMLTEPGKHEAQKNIAPEATTPEKKTVKIITTRKNKKTEPIQAIGNAFRENWILNQKPNHYTIQLTSVSQERLANRYISHHKLDKKVAYFRTLRKKEDWYSILYGSYSTKKDALSASKKIKKKIKANDVWVRKFADIQKAINKTGSAF